MQNIEHLLKILNPGSKYYGWNFWPLPIFMCYLREGSSYNDSDIYYGSEVLTLSLLFSSLIGDEVNIIIVANHWHHLLVFIYYWKG